jgi:chorismate mutase
MLISRRNWAEELGISPDFIANLYRTIVDHFVTQELDSWKNR